MSTVRSRGMSPKVEPHEDLTAEEKKHHRLEQFLERHGFADAHQLRNLDNIYSRIRFEALYPMDVAQMLGDPELIQMLRDLDAETSMSLRGALCEALQSVDM